MDNKIIIPDWVQDRINRKEKEAAWEKWKQTPFRERLLSLAPLPWKIAEQHEGRCYIRDANDKIVAEVMLCPLVVAPHDYNHFVCDHSTVAQILMGLTEKEYEMKV